MAMAAAYRELGSPERMGLRTGPAGRFLACGLGCGMPKAETGRPEALGRRTLIAMMLVVHPPGGDR
jgi:hypothetical protein